MPGVTTAYQTGVHGSRPAASSGCILYSCTTHGLVYRSDGSSWTTWLTIGTTVDDATIATSDVTTNNASTSKHGWLRKLDNDPTHYLDGQGNWTVPPSLRRAVEFVIDGGGSAITTGVKGDIEMPVAWTDIASARLFADQSGSIVVNIWKDTYANYPPTVADKITASAPPTISTATKSEDTTLTGWTKTGSAGDVLRFNVDSVTTIQRVTVSLILVV